MEIVGKTSTNLRQTLKSSPAIIKNTIKTALESKTKINCVRIKKNCTRIDSNVKMQIPSKIKKNANTVAPKTDTTAGNVAA